MNKKQGKPLKMRLFFFLVTHIDGKGFHALRRTLGKELTLAEIPIMTTAQILGHRSVDSSKQYISLDSAHLKECALDFSGIEVAGEGYGNE